MLRSYGIQNVEKYSRRRIFDRLLERTELHINNHGDYFEHLNKIKLEFSRCLFIFLFEFQNFWSDLSKKFGKNGFVLLFRLLVQRSDKETKATIASNM